MEHKSHDRIQDLRTYDLHVGYLETSQCVIRSRKVCAILQNPLLVCEDRCSSLCGVFIVETTGHATCT